MSLYGNFRLFGSGLVPAGLVLGLFLSACRKREVPPQPDRRPTYVRGDRIVAEQAAAQFFEARILASDREQLRVQVIGGNDSINVAASDVYRLPPAHRELVPNMLAICGQADSWVPCRVLQVFGDLLPARTATGQGIEVSRDRVIVPSALTELNLKRAFARGEAELVFARSALRAGEPRPEPGWRPAVHERLLVKLGGDWFTGYVREIGEDGAQVALGASQRIATVSLSALAPEPPSSFVGELRRGDFVLVRPETQSGPWQRCQIRAVNDKELKLSDATGGLKTAALREIVPLRP